MSKDKNMKSPITRVRLPTPSNEDEFEKLVCGVAKIKFGSDSFQQYGRRGQKQHGIDVIGNEDDDNLRCVVLQAKCYNPTNTYSVGEIKTHVEAAVKHEIKFVKFIWATTLDRDTKMQDEAKEVTTWLIEQGYPTGTQVIIWSWHEFTDFAHENTNIYRLIDPVSESQRAELLGKDTSQSDESVSLAPTMSIEFTEQLSALMEISRDHAESGLLGPTWKQLSKQTTKRPLQTIRDVDGLLSDEITALGDVDKSRAAGIKGHCYLVLQEHNEAVRCFQEAYALTPDRDASKANFAISLGIENKLDELRKFAGKHLSNSQPNEFLAANVLYFLKDTSFIPDTCLTSERVRITKLENERDSRTLEKNIADLREFLGDYPKSQRAKIELASILLEKVLGGEQFIAPEDLGAERREAMNECEGIYEALWSELNADENEDVLLDVSVPHNLAVVLRINGKYNRALDVLKRSLELRKNSSVLALQYAVCLIESDQPVPDNVIELLDESRDSYRIRLKSSLNEGCWEDVLGYIKTLRSMTGDDESGFLNGIEQIARISALEGKERDRALESALTSDTSDVRELVLLIQLARRFGNEVAETELFERAKESFDETSPIEARYALAHEARHHNDKDMIFDLLETHIDYTRDSEHLRLLAETAAEEFPSRERDRRVFQNIDEHLYSIERYQYSRAVYFENAGRLEDARDAWGNLHRTNPSLKSWLGLFRTSSKLNDNLRQRHLLEQNDLLELRGSVLEQIALAHLFMEIKQYDRAKDIAVKAMKSPGAMKLPRATAQFTTLFLMRGDIPLENKETVQVGAYVKMNDGMGDVLEGIIGTEKDFRWGKALDTENHIIRSAFGKKAGDTIEMPGPIKTTTWTIELVQSEWLRMVQYIPTIHEIDFGPDALIFRMKMVDGDVSDILDLVKRDASARDDLLDTLISQNIPITFAADAKKTGPLSIAAGFEFSGKDFPVATGMPPSFEQACQNVQKIKNGIAVDSFTLMTVMRLGVLADIAERFGPLYIPSICLNEMRDKLKMLSISNGDQMTLSAKGEQVYRDVVEKDAMPSLIQQLESDMVLIEKYCQIENVVFPDTENDVFQHLMATAPITASIISLSVEKQVPLLCEDMNLRSWAINLGAPQGFWLNVALWVLRHEEAIEVQKMVKGYAGLSALGHRHLSIDAYILIDAFTMRKNEEDKLEFDQLVTELGGEKADIPSHVNVAEIAMSAILKMTGDCQGNAKAASSILKQLFRGANKDQLRNYVKEFILRKPPMIVQKHLKSYLIGHFLLPLLE